MFTFALPRKVTALALLATIAIGAAACQARDGTTGAGAPTATHPNAAEAANAEIRNPSVQALLADAQAAAARHDSRTLHQIRARLAGLLRPDAVREVVANYRRVLANLAAAEAAHDPTARARLPRRAPRTVRPGRRGERPRLVRRESRRPRRLRRSRPAMRPMPAATSRRPTV